MDHTEKVLEFIRTIQWEDLPESVQHQSKRCLLDGLGALIAGHNTPVGALMESFAMDQFPGDQATILVSGQKTSVSGAVLANGFAANALDIDDGYRAIMGHPGACVLPVLLGAGQLVAASRGRVSGQAFLTALVVGYETGIRAGLIRHATYETYHSSGSWGAICGAASAGKLMGLPHEVLRHALGAAEYHAPIAPMMKCIDLPGMGKDSIGWGCMTAMMSVLMAQKGFTGIRPIFDDSPDPDWIKSLGRDWEILNLYFKPYSACRWAQPGVDGALKIMEENGLVPGDIEEIKVFTFKESAALKQDYPGSTEEAQYNICFPIASAILDGEVGPGQNLPPRLFDRDIRDMMDRIGIVAQGRFQENFPARAESEVQIRTQNGKAFSSGIMSARWDIHTALPTDRELTEKFIWLAGPVIGEDRARKIEEMIFSFQEQKNLDQFYRFCVK
ncbi:MmgE/PrpD family protein [Desulfospira joergensenii]|uniref:MmgE/PrpD family protein n=1 Tax=Desulfospira joergensenii TaxID=53329 RepID=UPI0003B48F7E|nr:MmgE/PrpD family protein [Desulfospira joergensenii]